MTPPRFRPHHFLCTLGFQGKGYSLGFVANYQAIADRLRGPGGDAVLIEVVGDTDSICEPCPNRRGKACESQEKIDKLDGAHAKVLGIAPGDQLTWKEAKELIREKMTPQAFNQACAPCAWKALGMCESALNEHIREEGAGNGERKEGIGP
jgi:uncharacterized protein